MSYSPCKLCGSTEDAADSRGLCFFCFARCVAFIPHWRESARVRWCTIDFVVEFQPIEPLRFEDQSAELISFCEYGDCRATPIYEFLLGKDRASSRDRTEKIARQELRDHFNMLAID